jgi:Alginate lyase
MYMALPNRRQFCFSCAAFAALPALAAGESPLILATPAQARRIRGILLGDPSFAHSAEQVRANADVALRARPWSVTTERPENVPAGPNDYFSEGPYWWPDPEHPGGPYIRKDGQRNPGRFQANRRDLGNLCTAVLSLGMGGALLGDSRCGEHAARLLSVWFLDSKTRMNPNLEFGQAIRGVTNGRGTGIIDTVSFIHLVQGAALLEGSKMLDADVAAGVKRWFADYLEWMTTSKKGLDEKKSGNNHSTWWTAQAAAYATFIGNEAAKQMAWRHYREFLVPKEIQPDGSCPREEARINSLSYSAMNLDAFSVLCTIAEANGVKLWQGGVEKAFIYLLPFLAHPDTWKKQQISKYSPDGTIFPGLAGIGLHSETLLAGYSALPRSHAPWVQWVDLMVRSAMQ